MTSAFSFSHSYLFLKKSIGGEQQHIARFIRVAGIEEEGKADFALQRDIPEHSAIKGEMGFNGLYLGQAGQVIEVYLTVIFTMPSFRFLGTGVEVAQVRIDSQFANQMYSFSQSS